MWNSEVPMQDPIAFYVTCSTYGTWLPGDQRGWVDYHQGWQLPNLVLELESLAIMSEDACILTPFERQLVEMQIEETCSFRNWTLHAVNCRSNHMHVVLSAPNTKAEKVRKDLKSWCTRRLKNDSQPSRDNWWAERGSVRRIWNEEQLERVIRYVTESQDLKHLDHNPTRQRKAGPGVANS